MSRNWTLREIWMVSLSCSSSIHEANTQQMQLIDKCGIWLWGDFHFHFHFHWRGRLSIPLRLVRSHLLLFQLSQPHHSCSMLQPSLMSFFPWKIRSFRFRDLFPSVAPIKCWKPAEQKRTFLPAVRSSLVNLNPFSFCGSRKAGSAAIIRMGQSETFLPLPRADCIIQHDRCKYSTRSARKSFRRVTRPSSDGKSKPSDNA